MPLSLSSSSSSCVLLLCVLRGFLAQNTWPARGALLVPSLDRVYFVRQASLEGIFSFVPLLTGHPTAFLATLWRPSLVRMARLGETTSPLALVFPVSPYTYFRNVTILGSCLPISLIFFLLSLTKSEPNG